jgi:type VI secretion system secreted protein Hcp
MPAAADSSQGEDIYLDLTFARSGKVKGESQQEGKKDQIVIVGWSWGMHANTAMGGSGAAGKATVDELSVRKQVDRSSTAIMSGLRHNDEVKKAVVTMRKAGGSQVDYLTITIEKGRVTSYSVDTNGPTPIEHLKFSFKKINVEYKDQRSDGLGGGAMIFTDEIYT